MEVSKFVFIIILGVLVFLRFLASTTDSKSADFKNIAITLGVIMIAAVAVDLYVYQDAKNKERKDLALINQYFVFMFEHLKTLPWENSGYKDYFYHTFGDVDERPELLSYTLNEDPSLEHRADGLVYYDIEFSTRSSLQDGLVNDYYKVWCNSEGKIWTGIMSLNRNTYQVEEVLVEINSCECVGENEYEKILKYRKIWKESLLFACKTSYELRFYNQYSFSYQPSQSRINKECECITSSTYPKFTDNQLNNFTEAYSTELAKGNSEGKATNIWLSLLQDLDRARRNSYPYVGGLDIPCTRYSLWGVFDD